MNQSTTFLPPVEYKKVHYDFKQGFGHYPRIKGDFFSDDHVWQKSQELAFRLIRADLLDGWEVDQSAWGMSCFTYKKLKLGMGSWDASQWGLYLLLGLGTLGISLIIFPFIKNSYIELQGVDVRLRRAKGS